MLHRFDVVGRKAVTRFLKNLLSSALLFCALLFSVFSLPLQAQSPFRTHHDARVELAPRSAQVSISRNGKIIQSQTIDPNEELRVIITFATPPRVVAFQKKHSKVTPFTSLNTLEAAIESDHARFDGDLPRLEAAGASRFRSTNSTKGQTTAHFRTAFNGVAFRGPRWLVSQISGLTYVKRITQDRTLKSLDTLSNQVIGADRTWTLLHATGKGVRIGFLDTGIDYTLPELGGGFGAGKKVRGGYDFVHNNADPMDDNGHGTSVAVTAAGLSSASISNGVAPDAIVYGYKVLDNTGQGSVSLALQALDAVVADSIEVLNMSFGAPGDPSDPLCSALGNLSALGIVSVAAAGNNGPSYQTMLSPGCGKSVISVGATDDYDLLADFSSRGPSDIAFTIKPDLVAPGVNIQTLTLGGAQGSESGTSMAAPSVTGAAALLLELHPDWTPAMIASALMGKAKDVGQDIWSQGKGRLDVYRAAQARVLALPQSLSLGLDDMNQSTWMRQDTISIVNLADSSVSYTIAGPSSGTLPAGISLSVSPSNLTLPPHATGMVTVLTQVDNSVAQIPTATPPAVTGSVKCFVRSRYAHDSLRLASWFVYRFGYNYSYQDQILEQQYILHAEMAISSIHKFCFDMHYDSCSRD
jgi:subtilisin family serine protease